MKNYIIGLMAVCIVFLCSALYKKTIYPVNVNRDFPVKSSKMSDKEAPFFLYLFFSKTNCRDCLEVIDVLNNLPPEFIVTGVVPENELIDEKQLRQATGASFPLVPSGKYKKYLPVYSPTIMGVSAHGIVLFVLPGVPGEKEYLDNFLQSLYKKAYSVLIKQQIEDSNTDSHP